MSAAPLPRCCSSRLLAAKASLDFRVCSLQPVSMRQAGLATPPKQRGAPGGSGGGGEAAPASTHLFVGLVEHQGSRRRHLAAISLGPSGLLVSRSSVLAPPQGPQVQQPDQVTAVAAGAGGCCWLGTVAGELLPWQLPGGGAGGGGAAAAEPGGRVHGCSGGGAVTSVCAVPGGEWQLLAATAGGCCTVLAR